MDDRESHGLAVAGALVELLALWDGEVVLERGRRGDVGGFSVFAAVPRDGIGQEG
jgi:hypothetical protein